MTSFQQHYLLVYVWAIDIFTEVSNLHYALRQDGLQH